MDRPNIIVIMADQLRLDSLGEYTPNINQLMAESSVFNRCYCASPLCVPARGSFFTGLYPNETGSIINPWEKLDYHHGLVHSGTANLYQLFEDEWDSWHTGKQHFFTEDNISTDPASRTTWDSLHPGYTEHLKRNDVPAPGGPGFRGFLAEVALGRFTRPKHYSIPTVGCYTHGFDNFFDAYIANTTVNAIRRHDHSKPLLLNAMFIAPHPPLEIPEPWFSMVRDVALPENVGVWADDQSPLQLYNLTGQLGCRYKRDDWQKIWPVYMGLVALLDHCVGMVIDELKAQGIYDNSLIIFTADHGEQLGSHGLWQKMCNYEESVRVPLSIKFPKETQKTLASGSDELVSHVDVLPTICEYCNIDIPNAVSGMSLMPVLKGGTLERNHIFIQFDGNGARGNYSRAIISRELFKLNVDLFKDEIFFEFYDLKTDPQEMNNLAFSHREEVRTMLPCLIDHMKRTGDRLELAIKDYDSFLEDYGQFRNTSEKGNELLKI